MRDYGIVSPMFWIGETGRALRKNPNAQRVAIYLMTAPSSEMTGVFYCPLTSILNEVGTFEDLLKPLASPPPEGSLEGVVNPIEGVNKLFSNFRGLAFAFMTSSLNLSLFLRWQGGKSLKS